ncbi:DUF1413 domain-containing protein [Lactococcus formosensis]|uniref:DUF1413 domain-containing protein n=1 Tax=Lactococcus formosensis TaxID=1281486 RepID=UPI0002EA63B1|nr:DUF1413 domain-containing protein [Lactococcus formosensis]MDG6128727.1 DUF1413 domain-containing protein [Lactococcus formosensis]
MNNSKISLTLNPSLKEAARVKASADGLSLNAYILKLLVKDLGDDGLVKLPEMKNIIQVLHEKTKGSEFTVDSLYSRKEWEAMDVLKRRAIGRAFRKNLEHGLYPEIEKLKTDSSNKHWYKKI